MVSMLVCVLTALLLFQLPLRGSLLALALVSAVFLVPALGQGLLISVTMKSQMAAAQLGLMTGFMPAMTMPYTVKEPVELKDRVPGDLIKATLVV